MGQNLFANVRNLNVPCSLSLSSGVSFKNGNAVESFSEMPLYNAPFNMPWEVTNCVNMFKNDNSLNSYIAFDENMPLDNMSGIFRNCLSFNQDFIIPDSCNNFQYTLEGWYRWGTPEYNNPIPYQGNVDIYAHRSGTTYSYANRRYEPREPGDYSAGFYNCGRFNGNVIFHRQVTNLYEFYEGCKCLNKPITIPRGTVNVCWMLAYCSSFNSPVTIPDTVEETCQMFYCCNSLNRPIVLPDNIKANCTFEMCGNLNVPIRLPYDSDLSLMFWSCSNYNSPIFIPYSRYDTMNNYRDGRDYRRHHIYELIENCINFNAPIAFDNAIEGLGRLTLGYAPNFNQPVIFPTSLRYEEGVFMGCDNFNAPVTVPDCLEYMENTFYNTNFNQPFNFPANLINATNVFYGTPFNQPITIPSGTKHFARVFGNCSRFDRHVTIPSSIENMSGLFFGCHNLSQFPYIPSSINCMSAVFKDCSSLYTSMYNLWENVDEASECFNGSPILNFNLRSRRLMSASRIVNVGIAANTFGKTPSGYHFDENNRIVGSGLGDPIGVAYLNGSCEIGSYNWQTNAWEPTGTLAENVYPNSIFSPDYYTINSALDSRNYLANLAPENRNAYTNLYYNRGALFLLNNDSWSNVVCLFADYRNATSNADVKFYWYKVVIY
mgnify:CR=1 FL=1